MIIAETDRAIQVPAPPLWTWVDERKSDGDHDGSVKARAFELALTCLARYGDHMQPGAPLWTCMVYRVAVMATPARIRWRGPLFHLMPYCLHPTADPQRRCIVNRDYKPIGYARCGWADYELADDQHITAREFDALHAAGVVDAGGYLHGEHDGPRSRSIPGAFSAYRAKLYAMLAPYQVQT